MLVKQGKSSDEIAKLMNISVSTVKDILGEEKEEPKKEDSKENKENEVQTLKSQVAMLKQKVRKRKE
jgi:transposase